MTDDDDFWVEGLAGVECDDPTDDVLLLAAKGAAEHLRMREHMRGLEPAQEAVCWWLDWREMDALVRVLVGTQNPHLRVLRQMLVATRQSRDRATAAKAARNN